MGNALRHAPRNQSPVRILDSSGRAFEPQRSTKMLSGGSGIPLDAADYFNPHMKAWNPYLPSPDGQINPYRDRLVARVRDLVRNDGWASGALNRLCDNIIGSTFRPISKPDYRALRAMTGNAAFDAKWAAEFGRAVDVSWRRWTNNPGHYCDAQRQVNVNQLMRIAFRHKLADGDSLVQMAWFPKRVGYGRAQYATAINVIDPDRLSNPFNQFDTQVMRGGVEIDLEDGGAAVGYHVRRAHQNDWFDAARAITWDYIPRETSWGRPIMIHDYDRVRASEHRGSGGVFAPILDRFRMLIKYDRTELDAAIINATFAAFVESPMDQQLIEEAMGDELALNAYQTDRAEYHAQRQLLIGESRMLSLYPGEKIGVVDAARPNSNFGEFEAAFMRNFASQLGMTEQQFSQDWRGVNYSSARAGLLEVWKTTIRRRDDFGANTGQPIRCAFMEEAFELDGWPLPEDAPSFAEAREAYAACVWPGPGRGYPDPVADREGALIGITTGLTTLEAETLENSGSDWEETLDQRAIEVQRFKDLGLEPPQWSGMSSQQQEKKTGSYDPNSPNYRSNQE